MSDSRSPRSWGATTLTLTCLLANECMESASRLNNTLRRCVLRRELGHSISMITNTVQNRHAIPAIFGLESYENIEPVKTSRDDGTKHCQLDNQ